MARWHRQLGKAGVAAARGGRRLRRAARDADAAEARGHVPRHDPGPQVDTRLTTAQGLLLVRYLAGKIVLGRLEMIFMAKYVLLALGVLLLLPGVTAPLGVVLIALFLIAALAQWILTRIVGRLAAFHKLSALDDEAGSAVTVWWPNLKRELRRVGLPSEARAVLRLGAGHVTRRLPAHEETAFRQIDWGSVIPRDQWQRARQVLARAAGAPVVTP